MIGLEKFATGYKPEHACDDEPPLREWTPEQLAVFSAVGDGTENIVCSAVAGAGKTTTVEEASKFTDASVGFVAFGARIASELRSRIGDRADCRTMHSLGFAAVKKRWPRLELKPYDEAPRAVLKRVAPDYIRVARVSKREYLTDEGRYVLDLVNLCKITLTDATNHQAMTGLVEQYNLDFPSDGGGKPEDFFGDVALVLEASREPKSIMSFADQIWLPVACNLPTNRYGLLIVDEVQDLSSCTKALAQKAGERFLIVGDARQAIMGFAGADCESMPDFRTCLASMPQSVVDRPLTVTFRCPQSHVRLARKIVPHIQAKEGAEEGRVIQLGESFAEITANLKVPDMVICRKNAPLVSLAYHLFSCGMPIVVLGRDLGKGLRELIQKLRADSIGDLSTKLQQYYEREQKKLVDQDAPPQKFQSLEDKVCSLSSITGNFGSLQELLEFISSRFVDKDDDPRVCGKNRSVIVLSSVHRAKGSEADNVFIIEPECMPMIFKCRDCWGRNPFCRACGGTGLKSKQWEIEQENNLIYVAVTRAKENLYFCGPKPSILC